MVCSTFFEDLCFVAPIKSFMDTNSFTDFRNTDIPVNCIIPQPTERVTCGEKST